MTSTDQTVDLQTALANVRRIRPDIGRALDNSIIRFAPVSLWWFGRTYTPPDRSHSIIDIAPDVRGPEQLTALLLHEGTHALMDQTYGPFYGSSITMDEAASMAPALDYWMNLYPHGGPVTSRFAVDLNKLSAERHTTAYMADLNRRYS